ncbi:MAG: multicopper oxidase domain-containing protein [Lautropia sp.]|nr:multicopper oxidase domain-containing protein [Lautropia sp.]
MSNISLAPTLRSRTVRQTGPALAALSGILLGFVTLSAQAQENTLFSTVQNPPVFEADDDVNAASGSSSVQPQGSVSDAPLPPARQRNVRLDVGYVESYLWNPNNNRYERVRMRSYHGQPNQPLVAPAIEIQPGTQLNVRLTNNLPEKDPSCAKPVLNDPQCFNSTNLHTHGLWVDPNGVSDNIFLSVKPGTSQLYHIQVPADHPAGTFWYHSHLHGSTALQVSSGMAGALIIRGNRYPSANTNGDLDTLLKSTPDTRVQERIVMLQQISYGCRWPDGSLKRQGLTGRAPDPAPGVTLPPLVCDEGDVGDVESYEAFNGPNSWRQSGRFTTINGRTLPRFVGAVSGRMERWRVIHGGVRDTVTLEFRKAILNNMPASEVRKLSGKSLQRFINNNCTGAPLTHYQVAADGLTMASMQPATQTTFQPGYRWDLLTVFPESGYYCVLDKSAPAAGSVNNEPSIQSLLGLVEVRQGISMNVTDIPRYVKQQMLRLADVNTPEDMRATVRADLENNLQLSHYTPHPTISQSEVNEPAQTLTFAVAVKPGSNPPQLQFQINGKEYSPGETLNLKLGRVQDWVLKSLNGGHPYHIHVNPFQIVSIIDPQGRDVSGFDVPDTYGGDGQVDTQFRGLKGVWKDTIFVKSINGQAERGQYTITVRTRYQRYTGDFVLHCHILDHEDEGMMQHVRIYDPTNMATLYAPVPVCGLDGVSTIPFMAKFKSPYGVKNPLGSSKIQASIMAIPR